jgi:hypothetical protein
VLNGYRYDAARGRPVNFNGSHGNYVDYGASTVGALAYAMDSETSAGLAGDPGAHRRAGQELEIQLRPHPRKEILEALHEGF